MLNNLVSLILVDKVIEFARNFHLASEGFPADISDLADSQPFTSVQRENHHENEEDSISFLPILSSTDRESPPPPPPPKRVYGISNIHTR